MISCRPAEEAALRASDKDRKRAERERRKAAGEVRVEAWLSREDAKWLKQLAHDTDRTMSQAVAWCIEGERKWRQPK